MLGQNRKALALNFVVVSAISLVVLVVIITIFVASVNEHDNDLKSRSKTLFYCDCIYKQCGKDLFCGQAECRDLGQSLGIDCEENIAGITDEIREKCGNYD